AVQGRVLDESGGALPGVVVLVTHQGSGTFRQVVSNADGSYFVTGILPGPYRITADLAGFKKYERPDVLLTVGNTATLDITLAVGGLEESITVSGQAPLVDVTSKQIGANIGQAELGALPIMNKDWMYAVGLTPGIQVASSTATPARSSPRGTSSSRRTTWPSPRRPRRTGAAPSAGRSRRTRRISSTAWTASSTTRVAAMSSPPGRS